MPGVWGVTIPVDGGMRHNCVSTKEDSCPLWRASGAYARCSPVRWTSTMTATTNATKQIIFRRRCNEGTRLLAEQVAKTDSYVILGGLLLITWRKIKRIRASFPKTSHTVYRLKRNEFLIWEWSKQHLPCPVTECADDGPVL